MIYNSFTTRGTRLNFYPYKLYSIFIRFFAGVQRIRVINIHNIIQ